jgi:hypothetical protein
VQAPDLPVAYSAQLPLDRKTLVFAPAPVVALLWIAGSELQGGDEERHWELVLRQMRKKLDQRHRVNRSDGLNGETREACISDVVP